MINLFQVDKSGSDIFEKDYSIVVVLDKKEVYGVNIPQSVKDNLIYLFRSGKLNINHHSDKRNKNRFRIRFHTSVIIQLIRKAIFDLGSAEDIVVQICNDIDGHFHEIKDMIFKHVSKLIPSLKIEDIVLTKFSKPSLIDAAGIAFRNNDRELLKNFNSVDLDIETLIKIIKK